MKSSLIIDVLKVWIKNYGGSYKIIANRKGDRLDEFLIGSNEIHHAYKVNMKDKIYYVIDFSKKAKNCVNKVISSENSTKLNYKEISKLLKIGMN